MILSSIVAKSDSLCHTVGIGKEEPDATIHCANLSHNRIWAEATVIAASAPYKTLKSIHRPGCGISVTAPLFLTRCRFEAAFIGRKHWKQGLP